MFTANSLRNRLTILFYVALMTVPGVSLADLTSRYMSTVSWSVKIADMPDFDQVRVETSTRTGLRGDGKMFCGPTAATDVLAYIANHGYPDVGLGAGEWDPEGLSFRIARYKYERVTNFLAEVGDVMNTDPDGDNEKGTGLESLADGIAEYLEDTGAFEVDYLESDDLPSLNDIGETMLDGGLVILVRGKYKAQADGTYLRVGGHIMPVVGARRQMIRRMVMVRDPAPDDTDSPYAQSDFQTKTYQVTEAAVETDKGDRVWRMHDADDANKVFYLDSIVRIMPTAGNSLEGHE